MPHEHWCLFSTPKPPASTRETVIASSKSPASRWENRRLTGRHLHKYTNPEREIDAEPPRYTASRWNFSPTNPSLSMSLTNFSLINGAELIIHNAPFDLGFLNAELTRLDRVPVETLCNGVTDTLKMARELHPGKRNSRPVRTLRNRQFAAALHGAIARHGTVVGSLFGHDARPEHPDDRTRCCPDPGRGKRPSDRAQGTAGAPTQHGRTGRARAPAGGDRQGNQRRLPVACRHQPVELKREDRCPQTARRKMRVRG